MSDDIDIVTVIVERLGRVVYKGDFKKLEIKSSKEIVRLANGLFDNDLSAMPGSERTTLFASEVVH